MAKGVKRYVKKYVKRTLAKRRRYTRRRTTRTSRAMTMYRSPAPLEMIKTFKFSELITIGTGSYTYFNQFFNTNSLYDPNSSTGGTPHQPMYFDQYCPALYNAYKVIRSTCYCKFIANTTVSTNNLFVGLDTRSTENADGTVGSFLERSGSRVLAMATQRPASLKSSWSLRKAERYPDDSQWAAAYNANPTTRNFFCVQAFSPDGTTNILAGQMNVLVTIYYTAVLSAPAFVSQS